MSLDNKKKLLLKKSVCVNYLKLVLVSKACRIKKKKKCTLNVTNFIIFLMCLNNVENKNNKNKNEEISEITLRKF